MSETIRFGIVGTSSITEKFLDGANHVKDFSLAAVYSREESKARDFAKKYGAENIFTDLEKMAKSDLIDAVYIASPNAMHAKQAEVFLKNKKHVLCEKAFASNVKEVNEMISVSKENKMVLMEAMKTEYLPGFFAVKENLHRIGKVRKYFGNYCQYSSRYDKFKQGIVLNAFKPELSNGSIMDIGVYCIHPMVYLFGEPNKLKANAVLLESGVDGEGSILFNYDNMEAVVMYSKITNSRVSSEIQGEEGNIVIDNINTFEKVKIVFRNGEEEDLSRVHIEDNMCYELEEFISLVKEQDTKKALQRLKVSKSVMEIMDEARKQIGLVFPADKN
ncbi:oxidoreductase [Clostridium acetobutylicum]|nr:oxidoreductase [Clostridium acetobutylicum]